MIILIIYSERDMRQIRNGNKAKACISCGNDIRIKGITEKCFCESKGTFYIFGKKSLTRKQLHEDTVLYGKEGVRNLTWRAGNEIPGQLFPGERLILGQRVGRRTDTGDRSRTKFPEEKSRYFLLIFYSQRSVHLIVLDHTEKRGKGDEPDIRTEQRKFSGKFFKDRWKQI